MSPKHTKYQRRNYYIDKGFQTKFILKFCFPCVAFGSSIDGGLDLLAGPAFNDGGHCRRACGRAYHRGVPFAVIAPDCFCGACGRVFGGDRDDAFCFPIKLPVLYTALKLMLGKLGEGDFSSPMKLREDDQLKQVAVAYNEAVEKINGKIKKIKNASSLDEVKNISNTFKT